MNDIIESLEKHINEDMEDEILYDSKFFQDLQKYRPTYHFIADIIVSYLKPKSVIDWGCGCGFILEKLLMYGITDLAGVEGNEEVRSFIPESLVDCIEIADVLLYQPNYYDLAITVEVAEHLQEKDSARFVNAICGSANRWVWFSAAQPGQCGTGYINCQPLSYWESIFKEVGLFEPDWKKTYELKQAMLQNHQLCLGFSWLRDNFILFRSIK